MVVLFAALTACATLLGGLCALHLRDRLHLILGFSAGAVIGVAFFDLLPEAIGLSGEGRDVSTVVTLAAIGFAIYMVVDRFVALHSHSHEEDFAHHKNGAMGAAALSIHSFFDGVAIGVSFHLSAATGIVVALAVLAHDFSDGINTVSMILLRNSADRSRAVRWLVLDAIAPVLGIAVTFFFSLSESALGFLLALFAGFFLYIGASDLLPESHHRHPVYWTTLSSLLGMGLLYVIVQLAV